MTGGLLQIVAYGYQDMYLTANPQITFFKVVYRRHTNFSIQPFELTYQDNPNFGTKGRVKLYRLGDLISKMYLKVVIDTISSDSGAPFAWIRRLGHAMINKIEVEIGGTVIERHYGTWIDIWYELSRTGQHERGYNKLIGDVDQLTEYNNLPKPQYTMYIPLQFWFNRHYGLALPFISIQYHEIYVNIEFQPRETLLVRCVGFTNVADANILEVGLVTDFIFLALEERRRFATNGQEYLVEQVQYYGDISLLDSPSRLTLDFNHPVKELIWAMRNGNYTTGKTFLCYSNKADWSEHILECSKMILLGSMILLPGPEYIIDSSGNRIKIKPGTPPPDFGFWEEFEPQTIAESSNGNLIVTNNSQTMSLWVNVNSLVIGNYSITNKISAEIEVTELDRIIITNMISGVLDRDISYPVDLMTDTRLDEFKELNVCVYQFSNYGLYITGKQNPLAYSLLEFNGEERVQKRNGNFFGTLQPYMHHSCTPTDGINMYSFACQPELLQPTGTSNFSRLENVVLTSWFEDTGNPNGLFPPLPTIYNLDTRYFVFCRSYNIFRVVSGLSGFAYPD